MKKFFLVLFSIFISVSIILLGAIIPIEIIAYDGNFYANNFVKQNITSELGFKGEDATNMGKKIADYLAGKETNIEYTVTINGRQKQIFNEKEITHMKDVKALFNILTYVKYGLFALVAILMLCIILMYKFYALKIFSKTYLWITLAFGIGLAGLYGWFLADFNSFWHYLHLAFFTNDLFIMNPTDIMYYIFSGDMFPKAVIFVASFWAVTVAVIGVIAMILICAIPKRERL